MTTRQSYPLAKIAVVSPHHDDGVFSCGDLLADHAGSTVITVFSGPPPPDAPLTEWDAASGFRPGDDVVAIRRQEDRAALKLLRANSKWLEFPDSQYGAPPSTDDVAGAIGRAIDEVEPTAVFLPLGLFHEDHAITHRSALRALASRPHVAGFAYEDAIYRRFRGVLAARLSELPRAGLRPQHVTLGAGYGCSARKRQAVACYRSQLRALSTPGRPGFGDAFESEGFWRLVA